GAVELLGAGQARGARADNRHFFARALRRWLGDDPTLGEGAFDNRVLDVLDRNRRLVNPQDAGFFAGGRTEPAGEFGKIVCGVHPADPLLPLAAINEVVPVGDDVPQGAAGVAEGDAAIHAASTLLHQFEHRERLVDFLPVLDALVDRPARRP